MSRQKILDTPSTRTRTSLSRSGVGGWETEDGDDMDIAKVLNAAMMRVPNQGASPTTAASWVTNGAWYRKPALCNVRTIGRNVGINPS